MIHHLLSRVPAQPFRGDGREEDVKEIYEVSIEKKKSGSGCLPWLFWGVVIFFVLVAIAGKK